MNEYPTYREREESKNKGWELYKKTEDINKKASILLHYIINSHYWRARKLLEDSPKTQTLLSKIRGKKYYPGYTLDIDHYVKNWIASNGDRLLSPDVLDVLEEMSYPKEKCKYMPDGNSIYVFEEVNDEQN